jgi:hypothetical protein
MHGMKLRVLERQPDNVRSVSTYKVAFYRQRLRLQHGQIIVCSQQEDFKKPRSTNCEISQLKAHL